MTESQPPRSPEDDARRPFSPEWRANRRILSDLYHGQTPGGDDDLAMHPMRALFGGGRRSGTLIIIGVLVVLLLVLHHNSANGGSAGPAADRGAKVGQLVSDQDLTFQVTKVTCGIHRIGTIKLGVTPKAGNQWCVVAVLNVAANSNTNVQFFDSNQYVYASSGTRFTFDSGAAYFLAGSDNGTIVVPHKPIAARIPFEIPNDQHIESIELHDSAFSPGVTVRLT